MILFCRLQRSNFILEIYIEKADHQTIYWNGLLFYILCIHFHIIGFNSATQENNATVLNYSISCKLANQINKRNVRSLRNAYFKCIYFVYLSSLIYSCMILLHVIFKTLCQRKALYIFIWNKVGFEIKFKEFAFSIDCSLLYGRINSSNILNSNIFMVHKYDICIIQI